MLMTLKQIGIIHSPFKFREGMPIQPFQSRERGEVDIFTEYTQGLKDIDGFSHLILIYWFHKADQYTLTRKPFLEIKEHGIFAIRHPSRPNPIGISTVKLLERNGSILKVDNIDVLDGTPLLDIKPYVPKFDARKDARIGWLTGKL